MLRQYLPSQLSYAETVLVLRCATNTFMLSDTRVTPTPESYRLYGTNHLHVQRRSRVIISISKYVFLLAYSSSRSVRQPTEVRHRWLSIDRRLTSSTSMGPPLSAPLSASADAPLKSLTTKCGEFSFFLFMDTLSFSQARFHLTSQKKSKKDSNFP